MTAPSVDRSALSSKGQRTRARILAAAEDVFGEVGYENTAVSAIAQAAEVAQGTIYLYFRSKYEIYVELIRDFASRVRHHVGEAVQRVEPAASRTVLERRAMEAFFEFTLEHPALYRIVREAQFVAPDMYRWYWESFVAAYAANFERLSAWPSDALDVETLGYAVMGLADVFGLRWVIWEKRLPPSEALDQLFALLSRGFDGLADVP